MKKIKFKKLYYFVTFLGGLNLSCVLASEQDYFENVLQESRRTYDQESALRFQKIEEDDHELAKALEASLNLTSAGAHVSDKDVQDIMESMTALMGEYDQKLNNINQNYLSTVGRLNYLQSLKDGSIEQEYCQSLPPSILFTMTLDEKKKMLNEDIDSLNTQLINIKNSAALNFNIFEPTREEIVDHVMQSKYLSFNVAKKAYDVITGLDMPMIDEKLKQNNQVAAKPVEKEIKPIENPSSAQVQTVIADILKELKVYDAEKIADVAVEKHGILREVAIKGYRILMAEDDE